MIVAAASTSPAGVLATRLLVWPAAPTEDPTTRVARAAVGDDLRTAAVAAIDGNREFLALATPTTALAVAQTRALTRQVNGLIRLVLRRLDGTD